MKNNHGTTGRRQSKLSIALQNMLTAMHIFLYRSTRGAIGGRMLNSPVLLLNTQGRKTGKRWTVPLLYLADGDNLVLVASNGGVPKHPGWYLNLQANPDVEIEIMGARKQVTARTATPEEKRRLWPLVTAMYPGYAQYQTITDRDIPLVLLRSTQNNF
jgi:deazaflavin-dependent oxidoreductase (nitroreductase family)